MLKLAFLPLYQRWKTATKVRSLLRGLNAAAVGLVRPFSLSLPSPSSSSLIPPHPPTQIFSAVYRLFRVGYIYPDPSALVPAVFQSLDRDGFWVCVVAVAFVACGSFGCPTPLAIVGGALGGMAWFGVQSAKA